MTTAPPALTRLDQSARTSRRYFLAGEGLGHAGACVHGIALPALAVLQLDASPGQAALLSFAATIPALVVSLPAGVLLGRYPLRTVMITTDIASATVVLAIPAAALLDSLSMPLLYAIALVAGSLATLRKAAAMAAVPLLADKEQLHRSNAQFTRVITTAGIVGRTLGTVLITLAGPARTLIADAVSLILSACCASRVQGLPLPDRAVRRPMHEEIREGLTYAGRDPVLRPLVVALTATSVGSALTTTLLPYHLLTTLKTGTTGLGMVMAAGSVGGLTGAFIAPRLVRRFGSGPVLTTGFCLHAVVQIPLLFAAAGPAWLIVLILAACGQYAAATVVGTTQRSVQQWHTPPELRTRVQQTALWLGTGLMPLAALAAGALATLTSVRIVMALGILVLIVAAGALSCSPIRALTSRDETTGAAQ
ncbi:MFS transporter (plasmid) [Streptomyces microflavus]|uniref:MFS transporter n=1 Tax=Streptomyces microflavus TaxID=1919 RepID=UPI002E13320C|nr:MFS transporter [Streptomyces microflavus]